MYVLNPAHDDYFEIHFFDGHRLIFTGLSVQREDSKWQVSFNPDYTNNHTTVVGQAYSSLSLVLMAVKRAYSPTMAIAPC